MRAPAAPPGLIKAMDIAVSSDTRMRPEHIEGACDWLMALIAGNVDQEITLPLDVVHLLFKALQDAIAHGHAIAKELR